MAIAAIDVTCTQEEVEIAIAKYNFQIFVRDFELSSSGWPEAVLEGPEEDLRQLITGPWYGADEDSFKLFLVK